MEFADGARAGDYDPRAVGRRVRGNFDLSDAASGMKFADGSPKPQSGGRPEDSNPTAKSGRPCRRPNFNPSDAALEMEFVDGSPNPQSGARSSNSDPKAKGVRSSRPRPISKPLDADAESTDSGEDGHTGASSVGSAMVNADAGDTQHRPAVNSRSRTNPHAFASVAQLVETVDFTRLGLEWPDRPGTPPAIRPTCAFDALSRRPRYKRTGSMLLPKKREFVMPAPIIILDRRYVHELYSRGRVELLPVLRRLAQETVDSRSLPKGCSQSLSSDPKQPEATESRVPVSARVSVEQGSSASETGFTPPDLLADAVCEKFPELKWTSDSRAKQSKAFDVKRYSAAQRPKVIAPLGKVEKSVIVRHFGHRVRRAWQ
jgi:hypothetical protein